MPVFGHPVELESGFFVMWGNRESCAVSLKNDPLNFLPDAQKKLKNYGLSSLWYFRQEHTADGKNLQGNIPAGVHLLLDQEGDYFVTNGTDVGISVITADCLPIVFFDTKKKVCAIAHAGWKGTVQGIVPIVLRQMIHSFDSNLKDIKIWFGPHAQKCCYEVQQDFLENIPASLLADVIEQRDGKLFFSNLLYNYKLLQLHGVNDKQIDTMFSCCTICGLGFHSRRNDGALYIGQSTIAWIRKE